MTQNIKMQNVSFHSVDEFLEFLPEDELKIVEYLRRIVFSCIPDATEKLSYNVPYYKRHKNICFIWPASVLWGKKKTYDGVRFGFVNGYLLTDERKYLSRGDRKQVYWIDFCHVKEIDVNLLKSFLFEALAIDARVGTNKK
jgi:hypothetical protein